MKTKVLEMMMMGLMLSVGAAETVSAQDYGVRNGGDVQEKRFNAIADDIKTWISKGGASGLKLPASLTLSDYEGKMLEAINSYSVSFVSEAIFVNGVEKDCENIPAAKVIRCNIERFKGVSESDQYVITHHEFAGIAGFETNKGQARSEYEISNQITSSLEKVTVLKLAVKAAPDHIRSIEEFEKLKSVKCKHLWGEEGLFRGVSYYDCQHYAIKAIYKRNHEPKFNIKYCKNGVNTYMGKCHSVWNDLREALNTM